MNEEKYRHQYVQFKRQSSLENFVVLQIIDMSSNIMYLQAKGDKKLLTLINATVSHEMRNPLNSI